ncbi:hypothetical protein ACJMK2_007205 [Sinanodonta woodiana]|uniref:SAM-dependent MTase RsmB/NOP-type domain-containing protein n=1 Tax=Sinanodonta woodiana TaxID=1069815 RepID=A0ABD3VIX5_SINWO
MYLYVEAARIINQVLNKKSSIKNLVFSSTYENKKQLYALTCECLKFRDVLDKILEGSGLLEKEKKFFQGDIILARVLLYEFLLGKGVQHAGKYRMCIMGHRKEINSSMRKILDKQGVRSLRDVVYNHCPDNAATGKTLPKYVRINLIKTDTNTVIENFKQNGWKLLKYQPSNFRETVESLKEREFMQDAHFPDLLVFPGGTDLHENKMCIAGEIIQQDKASCIPAHVLNPEEGAEVIDCCAAPGNKTSHVASLIRNKGKIFAFDKDARRMSTMKKLIGTAGVSCVECLCQDFLTVDPTDPKYSMVEYVLVDPSCSGSGIVNRLNQITDGKDSVSVQRLHQLSRFQISILKHALRFPGVKKVVYSTCSIHPEENEMVVNEVYSQVSDQFELVEIMPNHWLERGAPDHEHSQCFIRLSPDQSLTNGFFVSCFERRKIACSYDSMKKTNACKKKKKKSKAEKFIAKCSDNESESTVSFNQIHVIDSDKMRNEASSAADLLGITNIDSSVEKNKRKRKHEKYDSNIGRVDGRNDSGINAANGKKRKKKRESEKCFQGTENGKNRKEDLIEKNAQLTEQSNVTVQENSKESKSELCNKQADKKKRWEADRGIENEVSTSKQSNDVANKELQQPIGLAKKDLTQAKKRKEVYIVEDYPEKTKFDATICINSHSEKEKKKERKQTKDDTVLNINENVDDIEDITLNTTSVTKQDVQKKKKRKKKKKKSVVGNNYE